MPAVAAKPKIEQGKKGTRVEGFVRDLPDGAWRTPTAAERGMTLAEFQQRGGRSRSPKKIKASRRNLKKAMQAKKKIEMEGCGS